MQTIEEKTQARLVEILNKSREVQTIIVPTRIEDYWNKYANDVLRNDILVDMSISHTISFALGTFKDNDDLELVTKRGRLLKRFSRHYKESFGDVLSPRVMGILGDRLQYFIEMSPTSREYYVDFTDSINWSDGEFGKEGSCWWSEYRSSIPTFTNGGGWAIRFYEHGNNPTVRHGIGRTWILPQSGYLFCFNSYGIERPQVSKVIKEVFARHGIDLHYRELSISNGQHSEIPYINDGSGFVLSSEENPFSKSLGYWDIDLSVMYADDEVTCVRCGTRFDMDDDEGSLINDDWYCNDCIDRYFTKCDKCYEYIPDDEILELQGHHYYTSLCESCMGNTDAIQCSGCEKYIYDDYVTTEDSNNSFCERCQGDLYHCRVCNSWYENESECPDCDDDPEDDESDNNLLIAENDSESSDSDDDDMITDFISKNLENVAIRRDFDDGMHSFTQMVYRDSRIAGVFLFWNSDENQWKITHEASGMNIRSFTDIPSLHLYLDKISNIDWTRSAESIRNDSYSYYLITEGL